MTQSVKVMVRCRPMNKRQKQLNCNVVVGIDQSLNQISLSKPNTKQQPKSFSFDKIFDMNSEQSYIYEQTAFSLVDSVIQGYNGTIFAYGQTGCGKTHTMMGTSESENSRGIIPRTFHQIITFTNSDVEKKHLVQCSFIQIYNEQIHDLLSKNTKARMDLKQSPEQGVFVKDLNMTIVKSAEQLQNLMEIGFKSRATRETAMNKESSRSHSIFTIYIQSQQLDELGKQKFKAGKLNLVDLAGSERQSKTHAVGDGMKQAAKINLSLSALGNVISALVDGKAQHIPYRDSKLTRLLQDSLGGNTKTIMIAAVSPASDNYQETLSTLRYASRAKFIQNKPKINEDPKDTLLRQYADEIKALKSMLEGRPANLSFGVKNGGEIRIGKEGYRQQLQQKQELIRVEQQQKQRLRQQLQTLQKLIGHVQVKQVQKKQLQRMKKLKQKLKSQKRKQQQLKIQNRQKQQQLLQFEQNNKNLTQSYDKMRKKFIELKSKYVQNLQEMADLRQQVQRQKQELLETIRYQQLEISKYSGICSMILNQTQIDQIVNQSQIKQNDQQWIIAPFVYRDKTHAINFPRFKQDDEQQDRRELIFNPKLPSKQQPRTKGSYRISDVVRGAREHSIDLSLPIPKKNKGAVGGSGKLMYGQGLTPLKIQHGHMKTEEEVHSSSSLAMPSNKQIRLNPIIGGGGSKRDIGRLETDWGWK